MTQAEKIVATMRNNTTALMEPVRAAMNARRQQQRRERLEKPRNKGYVIVSKFWTRRPQ